MKKRTAFWVLALVVALMSGCQPESTQSSAVNESSAAASKAISPSGMQSSELNEVLPTGIERVSTTHLRYSNASFKTVVTFSDIFNTLCEDYKPKNGIYLQTADGTATLLFQQTKDKNETTAKDLVNALKKDTNNKNVKSDKNGDVTYRTTMKDKKENEVTVFQKIRLSKDGYTSFTLCCRPADTEQYQKIFEAMSLSKA